jgi:hypothetical protein
VPPLLRGVADLLRAAALTSALIAYLWPLGGAWRFLGLSLLMLVPRVFRLAPLFDLGFAATLLLATWAGERDWYVTVVWMDEVVHFVAVAAVAVTSYLLLAKSHVLPEATAIAERGRAAVLPLLLTMVGFTVACLWEFVEWVAHQFAPDAIHVGYDDTILDLALGGLGALLAGAFLSLRAHRQVRALSAGRTSSR